MPIYNYQCTNCEAIITLMHSFDEKHVDCPECMSENSLVKLLNRPFIEKNNTDANAESKTGTLTKKYIEENREILQQQRREVKNKNYDQS